MSLMRAIAVFASGAGTTVAFFVWTFGFLYNSPFALYWKPIVLPLIVPIALAFSVCVREVARGRRPWEPATSGINDSLDRRRRRVMAIVFGVVAAAFILAIFQGATTPEFIDGRHYASDHGKLTEITRHKWIHLHSLESRIAAGHLMALGLFTVLYLTQPHADGPISDHATRPGASGASVNGRPNTGHRRRRSTS